MKDVPKILRLCPNYGRTLTYSLSLPRNCNISYHPQSPSNTVHTAFIQPLERIKGGICRTEVDINSSITFTMIFNAASLSTIVLCALASLGSVAAAPSPFEYPEVVPGPGLPSLASLGITSKDLFEGTGANAPAKRDLLARFDRICYDNGCGRVSRAKAQACVDYLIRLDTQQCVVGTSPAVMCVAGDAIIYGNNISGNGQVSSYCRDVGYGAKSVVDNCTDGNGQVAGADAAGGNGGLVVSIERC